MERRKHATDSITKEVGPFNSIIGKFEAEKYGSEPLLDTYVELEIPMFCITWNERQQLMDELAEVIRKFQI